MRFEREREFNRYNIKINPIYGQRTCDYLVGMFDPGKAVISELAFSKNHVLTIKANLIQDSGEVIIEGLDIKSLELSFEYKGKMFLLRNLATNIGENGINRVLKILGFRLKNEEMLDIRDEILKSLKEFQGNIPLVKDKEQ